MNDFDYIRSFLKDRLSKKRFNHSLNVAYAADRLAGEYCEDTQRAYLAGLVHDICKEDDPENLKRLILECEDMTNAELSSEKLWHAPAGSRFIQSEFGISDRDVINAVRFHTIGRAGMSKIEEIVYLADLISEDRDYKDVEKMRKLAFSDFDRAMFEAVSYSIANVMKKHGFIPTYSLEAYNQYNYLCLVKKKNKEKKQ